MRKGSLLAGAHTCLQSSAEDERHDLSVLLADTLITSTGQVLERNRLTTSSPQVQK
jgi:hypothetical protein